VLDGLPAGVEVTSADLARDLGRRRLGYGRGARMTFEQDEVELTGGVRHGVTMGGPIAVRVGNSEWPKWETVMAADPVDPDLLAQQARNAPLTRPRPGHADLAGMQKYDLDDARPILERASARETAARVALGAVARAFLRQAIGADILSHVASIGSVSAPAGIVPQPGDEEKVDASEVRCLDAVASAAMITEIDETRKAGDTLGGVVEVLAYGLPPGLGSYVQGDRRLDARLAAALMGIQAIKGVEVGDGFEAGRERRHDRRTGNPGDVGEGRIVEAEKALEQQLQLIRCRAGNRRRTPRRHEGPVPEATDRDVRVADIDREEHGRIIRGPSGRLRHSNPAALICSAW